MQKGVVSVAATSAKVAAMSAASTPWIDRGALVVMLMLGVALAVGLSIVAFYVLLDSADTGKSSH
jgi:hypothetical protein